MQSIEYSFLTIKSTNIREPLITRFQSISCRNQISINFCLVLRWSYECFFWGLWILFSNISIFNFKIEWNGVFCWCHKSFVVFS